MKGSYSHYITELDHPLRLLFFMCTILFIGITLGFTLIGTNIYWDRLLIFAAVWLVLTILHIVDFVIYRKKVLEDKD